MEATREEQKRRVVEKILREHGVFKQNNIKLKYYWKSNDSYLSRNLIKMSNDGQIFGIILFLMLLICSITANKTDAAFFKLFLSFLIATFIVHAAIHIILPTSFV